MLQKGLIISSENECLIKDNIDFIVIRAGYTDYNLSKTKYKDKDFDKNYKYAKDNNLKIGVYYETRATSQIEAIDEIDFFINIIENTEIDYPILLKVLDDHNTIIYYPENQITIDKNVFNNIINIMYNKLKIYNYLPVLITNKYLKNKLFNYNSYNIIDEEMIIDDILYIDIDKLLK